MARRLNTRTSGITVHDIAYHGNGVLAEGFYVVLFNDAQECPDRRMIAIHFPDTPGKYTAVLDIDLTAEGKIGDAQGNRFRGDYWHDAICQAVTAYHQSKEPYHGIHEA